MREFDKRIRVDERRLMIVREAIQLILICSIGGLVLGFTISEDLNEVIRISTFCVLIAVVTGFVASIDRIMAFFNLKRISFLPLQITKIILHTFSMLIVFIAYFYLKDNHFIFTKEQFHIFIQVLIYSFILGFIFTLLSSFTPLIGYGVIKKYLSGKYHNPQEEERIFMFLDLKGSTTIAEEIGHKRFFSLINDILFEISRPIIQCKGEIYKYVGDEIIITWSIKNGIKNNNCIRVFFEIEDRIERAKEKYIKKYGVLPEFKAGVHLGKVVVGEMGDFKSEIAYMGDAVNTTARLQSECNVHNANLLISGELLFSLEQPFFFSYQLIDSIQLKGKQTETIIYKVFLPT